MAKTFATLNPNALGPGLALDLGNLVVTTNAIDLDGQRMVLSTIPKAVGRAYVEVYLYSNSQGDLAGLCSVGLAEVDSPLDEMVGGASGKSYGYLPADGGIYNAGAKIDDAEVLVERKCIGMYVNFQGESSNGPFLAWYDEGSLIHSLFLPPDKFWCVAISVGTTAAGAADISAFVNFGQRAFENQPQQVVT
jgi:hypothetical protein